MPQKKHINFIRSLKIKLSKTSYVDIIRCAQCKEVFSCRFIMLIHIVLSHMGYKFATTLEQKIRVEVFKLKRRYCNMNYWKIKTKRSFCDNLLQPWHILTFPCTCIYFIVLFYKQDKPTENNIKEPYNTRFKSENSKSTSIPNRITITFMGCLYLKNRAVLVVDYT